MVLVVVGDAVQLGLVVVVVVVEAVGMLLLLFAEAVSTDGWARQGSAKSMSIEHGYVESLWTHRQLFYVHVCIPATCMERLKSCRGTRGV